MKRTGTGAAVGALALVAAGAFWTAALAPGAPLRAPELDPSVLFAGDIMLDRNVARHAAASSTQALFAGVADLFRTADANVANLEGAITDLPSVAQRDHSILRFTFGPSLTHDALMALQLSAVSIANNHTYDFGASGYASTRQYLSDWGVAAFGHPYNASSSLSAVLSVRGKAICLVGYHALFAPSVTAVATEIARLRLPTPEGSRCYRIVVFAHWGQEYETAADAAQVGQARAFIDAGADLVIGAHPHVVQNVEVYKGKAIFYSLGNFMFDQNFSWETTHGLTLKATFGAAATTFNLTPVTVMGQEVRLSNQADSTRILSLAGVPAEFALSVTP